MRLLYQFISREMLILIARYTLMVMAMTSMACPVWLSTVPAKGNHFRVADGGCQRRVLRQVQELTGQRRNDHAQRLRMITLRSVGPGRRPNERAASVWPWLTDLMPERTISAMNAAV